MYTFISMIKHLSKCDRSAHLGYRTGDLHRKAIASQLKTASYTGKK